MDVAEFLAWDAPGNGRWQLVDGEPQSMAPANRTLLIDDGMVQLESIEFRVPLAAIYRRTCVARAMPGRGTA
jgi:hypothetical protein